MLKFKCRITYWIRSTKETVSIADVVDYLWIEDEDNNTVELKIWAKGISGPLVVKLSECSDVSVKHTIPRS